MDTGTISNAENIVKNIFVIGFFIGIGIGIYFLVKYLNSPAGKIIQELFGGIATVMEGMAEAMNFLTGLFNKCTQGKNNDGSSVSTGTQVASCFSSVGILLGVLFGVPVLMAGVKMAYEKLRGGSELAKEMETNIKDNIKNSLDENSVGYKERIEAIKKNLSEKGNYDDSEEGEARLEADAIKIHNSSVQKVAAEKLAQRAKDIADKTKNASDESRAKELQTKSESAGEAQATVVAEIEKANEMSEGDLEDTVNDANEAVEKEFPDAE